MFNIRASCSNHHGLQERSNRLKLFIYENSYGPRKYNGTDENIAKDAVQFWLNSQGHLSNISSNSKVGAVGAAGDTTNGLYITQIFATK